MAKLDRETYGALLASYDDNPFFSRLLGAEILELGPRYAKARMAFKPELANQAGFFHGGSLYAFADSIVGLATRTEVDKGVTLEGNLSYMANVREGYCYCEATCLHYGGRTAIFRASCTSDKGQLLAEGRFIMYVWRER